VRADGMLEAPFKQQTTLGSTLWLRMPHAGNRSQSGTGIPSTPPHHHLSLRVHDAPAGFLQDLGA